MAAGRNVAGKRHAIVALFSRHEIAARQDVGRDLIELNVHVCRKKGDSAVSLAGRVNVFQRDTMFRNIGRG